MIGGWRRGLAEYWLRDQIAGVTLVTLVDLGSDMTTSTTLKLPKELKARINRLASEKGLSAHGLMIAALEREIAREERLRDFVEEALAADRAVEEGAAVYGADDVHAWLDRRASGESVARPTPWRK